MEGVSALAQTNAADRDASVVLDIRNHVQMQYSDKCSGSPKLTKVLSRKGSNRMDKQNNAEDFESDDVSKKIVVNVICPQHDQLRQAPPSNKALVADAGDGRNKKFNRLKAISPRNILFFFATMSSMGTMLLIYFTLAIRHGTGV